MPEVVRLAAMNLYLHGITGVETMIEQKDALLNAGAVYDVILTNPPFGKKQSYRIVPRRRRGRHRARGLPPLRLLRHHLEQATQLFLSTS